MRAENEPACVFSRPQGRSFVWFRTLIGLFGHVLRWVYRGEGQRVSIYLPATMGLEGEYVQHRLCVGCG